MENFFSLAKDNWIQGRSQVFIGGGGARWGNVKFIHKTLLQNINPEKFLL